MIAQVQIPQNILIIAIVVAILVELAFFMGVFAKRYRRVGPNEALIVSGMRRKLPGGRTVGFRIKTGGGTFVWPVLEQVQRLSLEVIPVSVTADGVSARAHVKVKGDHASIAAAAERFLTRKPEEIAQVAADILAQPLREAIKDGRPDPDVLAGKVAETAAARLAPLGLEIVSFVVPDQVGAP